MAFDKRKALQAALAYTQQGRWEKAIGEYLAILKADPRDVGAYNMLGDLYARLGNREEAISYYLKLAELYRADGLSVKAIAVYKKIIKLDPTHVASYLACGDLYAEQGLVAEARLQYLSAADLYAKEGSSKQALGVYRKLADLDPSNLNIRVRLAEMLLKEGLRQEAVDELAKVASGWAQVGQVAEAEKFYQRILQVEPGSSEARLGLGRLYYGTGDFARAIAQLSALLDSAEPNPETMLLLADAYRKNEQWQEAESVLTHVLERDPQNWEAKVALGELSLQQGKTEEGFAILSEVAEEHIRRNEAGKGIELLAAVKAYDPHFLRVREKLAETLERIGDKEAALKERREIADIHFRESRWREAREAYLLLLKAFPDEEQLKSRLEEVEGYLRGEEAEVGVDTEVGTAAISPIREEEEVSLSAGGELPQQEPNWPEPEIPVLSVVEGPPPPTGEERRITEEDRLPEELKGRFLEAEVYLKYGLAEKAIDFLKRIVAAIPDHPQPHRRLKEVYFDRGDREAALAEAESLADIYEKKGLLEQWAAEADFILKLKPDHEIGRKLVQLGVSPLPSPEEDISTFPWEEISSEEEVPERAVEEGELELESALEAVTPFPQVEEKGKAGTETVKVGEEEELPEELKGFLEELEEGKEAEPIITLAAEEAPPGLEEDLAEADFYAQHQMVEEAKAIYRRILQADPSNEVVRERLARLEPELAGEAVLSEEPAWGETGTSGEEPAIAEGLEVPAGEGTAPSTEGELLVFSEPERMEQPGSPREVSPPSAILPELATPKEVTPVFKVAPVVPSSPDEVFIDLAAELEKELAQEEVQQEAAEGLPSAQTAPPTLEEILQEFRKGVRQSLEEGDSQTHYDLALAYKDMDLLEEAVEEFRLAAKDRSFSFDCSQLIGLCYLQMGQADKAIEEFLKALTIPDQRPEQYRALKYELARAFEASGEEQKAADLYLTVFQEDPGFRDVAAKVKSREKASTKPAGSEEESWPRENELQASDQEASREDTKPPSPKPPTRRVEYI
jgi:tetratricopeptide (TPR) repeat protein